MVLLNSHDQDRRNQLGTYHSQSVRFDAHTLGLLGAKLQTLSQDDPVEIILAHMVEQC